MSFLYGFAVQIRSSICSMACSQICYIRFHSLTESGENTEVMSTTLHMLLMQKRLKDGRKKEGQRRRKGGRRWREMEKGKREGGMNIERDSGRERYSEWEGGEFRCCLILDGYFHHGDTLLNLVQAPLSSLSSLSQL